ncbi:uridine kinase [Gilvimarinus sp. DA14]|uniref:uridine kinase family protein n=1 Tax=Gilvimarinus sp. DA14 TaxID=2956798 RepID=UPI0020B86930|nr:hypothetical protein [Gilvimarinus sp. DA14]UTF60348.1 hypothetical protein NHM04_00710 [Gilvimarinus sp. DA14]
MTFWLLTIAGVSASGKTTLMDYLARGVHKRFGYYPTCVSMDGYYRDFSALAPHELQQVNYDHPDSFDVTALIRDLRYLKAGKPIYPRSYDYVQHKPVEAVTLTETKPVLVLEGILPLHFTEILSLSDLTVYIDTPINDCYARRLRRDTLERGRSEESIRYQFETHVMPMYNAYIQPQKERADRVLADGGQCPILLQDIVEKVAACRD